MPPASLFSRQIANHGIHSLATRAREEGLGRQLRGALTALGGGDGLARRGGCDDVHLLVERWGRSHLEGAPRGDAWRGLRGVLGCALCPRPEPAEEPCGPVRRCCRRGEAPPSFSRRAHEKLEQQQRVLDEDEGPQPVGVRRRCVPREAVAGEDGHRGVGHEGEERDRAEHLPG